MHTIQIHHRFLPPGHLCVPLEPTRLAVVAASGVAVTLFDPESGRGGMGHYLLPVRENGVSNAMFAAPAIVALARMLLDLGSRPEAMEAQIYGGAERVEAVGFQPELAERNVRVGEEVLLRLGIPLVGKDVGGNRARKVIFHSATGETVVAKVERVRATDWYPDHRRWADTAQGGRE
ncbi:chemotaxis protein CheD [Desulfonatronum parangueonense]